VSFKIGSQHAGLINNVDGTQIIHGDQQGAISSPAEILSAVKQLREEIEVTGLARRSKANARQHVDEIEKAVMQKEPDKPTIGDRLARLTKLLVSAGALATAGSALAAPISKLAMWLGSFGATALSLLPGANPANA
jgi:hypothetical protein